MCAFSERTQVGRAAIVAGLRLMLSGALWAHSDDGLEDGSGTLPGSSKADTPENPSSPSPYLYTGIGMVMIREKGVPRDAAIGGSMVSLSATNPVAVADWFGL